MADNTIDTLMLEVESNAEKSADGLDRLAASLAKIGKSVNGAVSPLSSFASSIKEATTAINSLGSTREISSLLSQLTQLSRIKLDNLENKKIRIDFELNGVESGQLKYAIQKAIDGVKVDTTSISKQLANSFNLDKNSSTKLQQQMQTIANTIASSFDGKNFHMGETLDVTLEEIANNIKENGSLIQSSITGSLDFALNEYKEFYDYFNTHKIYISDYLKADIGKTEFAEIIQQNLSYITRNAAKGIELNSVWEELSSKFPTLIPPGITNAADQVVHVLEEIKNARDQIKPVAIGDLVSTDQASAMDRIWESIIDSTRNLSSVLSQRIKDATEYAQDKINLDVQINEEKIIQDIRKAINRAASAQYDPVKVKLSVDSKNIQNSVSQELKGIDPGNLPQISDGMEKIANAMLLMNGVNFKDTGLSSIIKSLGSLSSIDTTKFNADGIAGLANALGALGYVNFKGTGLNSVIKSLRELSSVDMGNFSTDSFSGIVQSISSLGQIPDISSGINKLVASLAKLAGAGASITTVSQQLPVLGNALHDVVNKLASANSISESVNQFVQSLAKLAGAGSKTTETAAGLDALGQATLAFFQVMQGAPKISDNTLRMTEALAKLAASGSNLGKSTNAASQAFQALGNSSQSAADIIVKAMNKIYSSTKKAFSSILKTVGNAARGTLSAAKSIASSITRIGNSSKSVEKMTTGFRSLFRAVVPFAGIYGIFNWGKEAVETASNLTEVQNIVRTTFGDMTQEVNEFAKNSIKDLGMSELTFKQVASRFQAMGTAMGISSGQVQKATQFLQKNSEMYGKTADSMGDMSIELTRLAADMASFYDVAQEDVAEDLASIFTGQTRPLRTYGLDLTEATLKEWAMKNGLDANISSMSQAQKTLLRYQYVLSQTGAAQGDFLKTANTWHNLTTVLSQSFQQFSSIVGEVIINALKPFVAALNSVMGHVITFARTVADALGKIFGWTLEVDASGVVDNMQDAADSYESAGDSAGDVADGTKDAAKSAKKLKKELSVLPFDELNQLAKDMDYAGSGGGGGGGGQGGSGGSGIPSGGGITASLVKTDSIFDKYKSDIDSLEELGKYIGDALTKALKKINWDKVYKTAENFGKGLASFLNGLISPELFSEVGKTIAGAMNTALHFLDSFGKTFDWTNFGKSLSSGVKSFLKTYDWDLKIEVFNTFANGILDTIIAALDSVSMSEWQRIPQKIGDMIEAVDASGISWKLGDIANSLVNAFYQLVANKVTWSSLGNKIAEGINSFFEGMNAIDPDTKMNGWEALGQSISKSISGIVTSITRALKGVKWEKVGQAIADFIGKINFGEIGWNLGQMANSLANALYTLVSNKSTWVNLGKAISNGLNEFFRGMNQIDAKTGKNGWQALGESITESMSGIVTAISTALEGIGFTEIGDALTNLWDSLSPFAESVGQGLVDFLQEVLGVGEDFLKNTLPNGLNSIAESLDKISPETATKIGYGLGVAAEGLLAFKGLSEIGGILSGIATALSKWTKLKETFGWLSAFGLAAGLGATAIALDKFGIIDVDWDALWNGLGKVKDILVEFVKNVDWTNISEGLGSLWDAFQNFTEGFAKGLLDTLNFLVNDITAPVINALGEAFKVLAEGLDMIPGDVLKNIGEGLGSIAGSLIGINIAKGGIDKLKELFTFLGGTKASTDAAKGGLADVKTETEKTGGEADKAKDKFGNLWGNIINAGSTLLFQDAMDQIKESLDGTKKKTQDTDEALGLLAGAMQNSGMEAGLFGLNFSKIEEPMMHLVNEDAPDFNEAADEMTQRFINFGGSTDKLKEILKENLTNGACPISKEAFEMISGYIDTLNTDTDNAETSVKDFTATVGEETKTVTSEFKQMSENSAKTVTEGIGTIEKKFDDGLKNAANSSKTHFGNIETSADDAATATENVGTKTDGSIGKFLLFQIKSVLMTGALGAIKTSAENADEKISLLNTTIGTFVESLSSYAGTALEKGKEVGKNYPDGIAKGIEQNKRLVSDAVKNIKDAFDISLYSKGQSVGRSFASGIRSVKIPVPNITFSTSSWVSGNTSYTQTSGSVGWKYMAQGGLVTDLTNAILGENGKKEAVLPLENSRAMKMIGASILSGMESSPLAKYRLASMEDISVKHDIPKTSQRETARMRNTQIDNKEFMDAITGAVVTAMMNNQQNPINVTCYAELKTENDEVLARAVTRGQKSLDYRYNPTPKFGY